MQRLRKLAALSGSAASHQRGSLAGVAGATGDEPGELAETMLDLPELRLEHGQFRGDRERGLRWRALVRALRPFEVGSRLKSDANEPASTPVTRPSGVRHQPDDAPTQLPGWASFRPAQVIRYSVRR
jgi:hypothetical protein